MKGPHRVILSIENALPLERKRSGTNLAGTQVSPLAKDRRFLTVFNQIKLPRWGHFDFCYAIHMKYAFYGGLAAVNMVDGYFLFIHILRGEI